MEKIKAMVQSPKVKNLLLAGTGTLTVLGTAVTAFAADPQLPTIAITTEMLTPLVDGVVANIGVILPVGIGLFAIFLGIRILPGLISKFVHM